MVDLIRSINDYLSSGSGSSGLNQSRNTVGGTTGENRPSFAIEQVHAILTPFHWPDHVNYGHPLYPIMNTNGLAFPYSPSISEGMKVNYDRVDLTHSNEAYHSYRSTENTRISISDATWTCDTFSNAVYALSALHFFRSYRLMDFGRGRTARPPSPMWFSAYGNYAYHRVPVLLESADWTFPNDVDYVGIPEPGTDEYVSGLLQTNRSASGKYTWLPMKFTVSGISLIVQHTPKYWTNFNLQDFWSGQMLTRTGSFHSEG